MLPLIDTKRLNYRYRIKAYSITKRSLIKNDFFSVFIMIQILFIKSNLELNDTNYLNFIMTENP